MVTNSNFGSSRERPREPAPRPADGGSKPIEITPRWLVKSFESAMREQLELTDDRYLDQATTLYTDRTAVYWDLARKPWNRAALESLTQMVADDIRTRRPVTQLELVKRTLIGDVKDLRNIDPAAYQPEPMPVAKKQISA